MPAARATEGKTRRRSSADGDRAAVAAPKGEAGRPLPEDLGAEISVLGAMILHNNTIDVIIPVLKPEGFSNHKHRRIYEAILSLHGQKMAVDLVTLRRELQRDDALDGVGGVEYLAQIVDAVPAAANAEHYAQLVRERQVARSLIGAAEQIMSMAYDGADASQAMLDKAMKLVFDIAESGMRSQMTDMKDIIRRIFEQIDKWKDRKDRLTGVETGYYDLDDKTSGLQPEELIVLAARPSMGKTTMALNIALNVALKAGKGVGIFSLEMAHTQVALNMLSCHARVDAQRLRRGRLSDAELTTLSQAAGTLSEAPIYIDDTAGLTPMELRAKARRLKSQHDIQLIIVDYLQLMESPGFESRQQEISAISRSLKALARELHLPVIAVAQLNRGVEDRPDHRPRMSDLRESGSIEQDADVVALLHRPSYYAEGQDTEESVAELILAKQRNGPTGTVKLTYVRNCFRFENSTAGQEY